MPSEEIRKTYGWEDSCQGTVPPAIRAFLDSSDYESAVRIAVSLGGDSDTLACITGGIAEAYYGEIQDEIVDIALARLPEEFKCLLDRFTEGSFYHEKAPKSEPSVLGLPQSRRDILRLISVSLNQMRSLFLEATCRGGTEEERQLRQ